MKKLFVLFLLVGCAVHAQQKINFRDDKLADILQAAKTQGKPIMYMGYASWCEHCKKMKEEVITDPAVAEFYNANFICTWQDMEKDEGVMVRKKYGVKAFPVFLFFDSKGELLYSVGGEMKPAEFLQEGKNALDEKKQFPYLKAQFDANPYNADACFAYVAALRRSNFATDDVAERYLSAIDESKLVSEINWRIIANGIRDINSREFQYALKHQSEFAAVSSQKRIDRKIVNIVQEWLLPYVDANDTVGYFKKRPAVVAMNTPKSDSLVFNYDLKVFEKNKDWKSYRKSTAAYVKKVAWKNGLLLKEISMNYMNNIDDPKATDDAIEWAKRSFELRYSYDIQLILGRLYLKKGDMKNAKDWGEKAKAMAVSYNWNTEQADMILQQIKP